MIAIETALAQYIVRVSQQGTVIASHLVNAPDALSAINFVERYYYQPVKLEKTFIENEDGKLHEVTVASNWHGYMFEAQSIKTVTTSATHHVRLAKTTLPESIK